MKKLIIILTAILIPIFVQAQDARYYQAMGKSLTEMSTANNLESLQKTANDFGRIAAAESEQWLPLYYQSLSYMQLSLMAMSENPSKLDSYLTEAQTALDKASALSPNNSEITTLQGYIYIGHIWSDPMTNGAIYSPKAGEAFGMAIALDPENPRPHYLQGMNTFYTPEFYGGGAKSALPILERAESLYNSFEAASELHPNWGVESNTEILTQIRENK